MPKAVCLLVSIVTLFTISAFAVDGVVLINQASVMAAGGFPYKITQSGSYKLSGNLLLPDVNTTAIVISTNDVTLDLNGFAIQGPNKCIPGGGGCIPQNVAPGLGVSVSGAFTNIRIVNGSIGGTGGSGIVGSSGSVLVIADLVIRDIGNNAIELDQGIVMRSKMENSWNAAISCSGSCSVESSYLGSCFFGLVSPSVIFGKGATNPIIRARDNTVINNPSFGIQVGSSSLLIGNVITGSTTNLSGTPAVNSNNVCGTSPC